MILEACISSTTINNFDYDHVYQKALEDEIFVCQPDLIGLTCMFTQSHRSLVDVRKKIKELAPKIPIACGGVHISNSLQIKESTEQLIWDVHPDFLFRNECEIAFPRFINVVNRKADIASLAQVVFSVEGKLIRFENRMVPQVKDLHVLPAYDLSNPIQLSKWGKVGSYSGLIPEKKRFATVLSNRGCRAKCTFCSVRNFNGIGVRRRKVSSVVDELLMLQEVYGVEHIMWLDDDFLYNRNESMALFNEMIRRNIQLTWDCTNGVIVAALTEDIVEAAAESGCIGLNLGVESGNESILRQVKKPGTPDQFLKGAEILRRYPSIFVKVFLIIGFPGETYRQLLDTISLTREMNMDWHLMQILQPLPNTPIFDLMLEDGLIDARDFNSIHVSSGAYGKIAKESEANRDLLERDFTNAFNVENIDAIIPREALDEIWAYMNYHQNYAPLSSETRPMKLKQKWLHLTHLFQVVAPKDAMAMFFSGLLERRLYGTVSKKTIRILSETLDGSPYWCERFNDFKLCIHQLE